MNFLKNLLKSNKNQLSVSKEEIEILVYILNNRHDFEDWFAQQAPLFPKVKFVFYYPTAIDLYFDAFKLFTVFFTRDNNGQLVFSQAKISRLNAESLKSTNWAPFKEVMVSYLMMAQERNSDLQFQRLHALHEYQALCNGGAPAKAQKENSPFFNLSTGNAMLPDGI